MSGEEYAEINQGRRGPPHPEFKDESITPETDIAEWITDMGTVVVDVEKARQLETQRDNALAENKRLREALVQLITDVKNGRFSDGDWKQPTLDFAEESLSTKKQSR